MTTVRSILAGLVAGLLLLAGAAKAEDGASAWAETDQTAVRLISAGRTVGTEDVLRLGVEFKLKPDWKVYWRSPGDAGFPPSVSWDGSTNLADAALSWPVPERFSVLGLQTMGYHDHVVLPVAVRPREPGQPVSLRAAVDYLACSDICIPYTASLALDLPAGPPAASPFAHTIDQAESAVPGDPAALGVSVERAEAAGTGENAHLRVVVRSEQRLMAPDLFVEGAPALQFGEPRVRLEENGRLALLDVPVSGRPADLAALPGANLILTLADGPLAVEAAVTAETGGGASGAADAAPSLATILLAALIGGFILNLMPCVLPVLSIKLLKVVGQAGRERRHVRLSFLASAAGIVVSFLGLAAGAIALKFSGAAVGWGIQFQQPLFLTAMVVVLMLFAANLWGLFGIGLPSGVTDRIGRPTPEKGLAGDFAAGAFATLLATPCSAPFLGTAVGFALSRDWPEIVLVFAALGLGLALPFLALALAPGLVRFLPKPGPWMATVKRVLGVFLAATAVWLLTVMAAQIGVAPALLVAALMIAQTAVLWFGRGWARRAAVATAAVAALAVAAAPLVTSTTAPAESETTAVLKGIWKPFDRAAIPSAVRQGKVVFVDVTADWCITCQVNKRFVLARGAVAERLKAPEVVAMQADWTRPDEAIADYLASFGRYGIPFNVVYGPGAPEGVALPEILTEGAVLAALRTAAGAKKASADQPQPVGQ